MPTLRPMIALITVKVHSSFYYLRIPHTQYFYNDFIFLNFAEKRKVGFTSTVKRFTTAASSRKFVNRQIS